LNHDHLVIAHFHKTRPPALGVYPRHHPPAIAVQSLVRALQGGAA
jgi:hypothetical protein